MTVLNTCLFSAQNQQNLSAISGANTKKPNQSKPRSYSSQSLTEDLLSRPQKLNIGSYYNVSNIEQTFIFYFKWII